MSTTDQEFQDAWDALEEEERAEVGSGGVVADTIVHRGYKVYATGVAPTESFFPYPMGNEAAKQEARARAQKLSQESGGARVAYQTEIRALKDGALTRGKPAGWQGDRCLGKDAYTAAYKEVVKPSLYKNRIAKLPWRGWARIGFAPDPYHQEKLDVYLRQSGKVFEDLSDEEKRDAGMTERDQDDSPRMPMVAYIVETFSSKEEAYAAAGFGEGGAEEVDESVPGWLVEYAKQQVAAGKSAAQIATEVDKPVSLVIKALEQD